MGDTNTLSPAAKAILAEKAKKAAFAKRVRAQTEGKPATTTKKPVKKKAVQVAWREGRKAIIDRKARTRDAIDKATRGK